MDRLRVFRFRNLVDADLELPAAGCVIVGANGHGKTSLIEALLYCELFRSFRGASDREVTHFGADGFRVEVRRSGNEAVAAGYDARTKQKKITVNGAVPERLADAIGLVRGVVLSPGDVALVAGGPRERRRYLDVQLSLTVKGYVEALTRYRRAMAHRGRASAAEAESWEAIMAESGARIVEARRAWTDQWSVRYGERCTAMGESGEPRLSYLPREGGGVDALRAALERSREKDRIAGRTSVGPHRDELRLALDGRSLRHYGSAGQQRTAAIALRLLETEAMTERGGTALLCLDDAFAELDARRSRLLGETIEQRAAAGNQIVAAVPKEHDVPDVIASLPRWHIELGSVGK